VCCTRTRKLDDSRDRTDSDAILHNDILISYIQKQRFLRSVIGLYSELNIEL